MYETKIIPNGETVQVIVSYEDAKAGAVEGVILDKASKSVTHRLRENPRAIEFVPLAEPMPVEDFWKVLKNERKRFGSMQETAKLVPPRLWALEAGVKQAVVAARNGHVNGEINGHAR